MGKEAAAHDEFEATIDSGGQITLPSEVLALWDLKPGDKISLAALDREQGRIRPLRRRSIFERLDELKLPSLGRPFAQSDIDESVAQAMLEKYERSKEPS